MITIVGMGQAIEDVTLRGAAAIRGAATVVVRTAETNAAKTLDRLGVAYITCDDIYNNAADFDQLVEMIAARLCEKDCVYCVDGAGTQDAVGRYLQGRIEVKIITGVDSACSALALTGQNGESFLRQSATSIVNGVFFAPDATLVVDEIDDALLAGELQLKLLDAYGDVACYYVANGKTYSITVGELCRQKGFGYDAMLVLPAKPFEQKERFSFVDLVRLLARLRAPDGCEWDKVQTHQSIRDCCIEEAYELVEAIDLDDVDKMQEECGDVLLQAVFQAAIGEDAGEFGITDMLSALCHKLLMRHPHVFGSVSASNAEEALAAWDAAKAVEKKQVTYTQKMQQVAPMSALMRAKKIQKIAAKAHYDFDSVQQAAGKIDEELQELMAAPQDERETEGGDLLFSCVNVLRLLGVDPELALLASIRKFQDRFAAVEQALAQAGKRMEECDADTLWAVYDTVKQGENR